MEGFRLMGAPAHPHYLLPNENRTCSSSSNRSCLWLSYAAGYRRQHHLFGQHRRFPDANEYSQRQQHQYYEPEYSGQWGRFAEEFESIVEFGSVGLPVQHGRSRERPSGFWRRLGTSLELSVQRKLSSVQSRNAWRATQPPNAVPCRARPTIPDRLGRGGRLADDTAPRKLCRRRPILCPSVPPDAHARMPIKAS